MRRSAASRPPHHHSAEIRPSREQLRHAGQTTAQPLWMIVFGDSFHNSPTLLHAGLHRDQAGDRHRAASPRTRSRTRSAISRASALGFGRVRAFCDACGRDVLPGGGLVCTSACPPERCCRDSRGRGDLIYVRRDLIPACRKTGLAESLTIASSRWACHIWPPRVLFHLRSRNVPNPSPPPPTP